MPPKTLMNPKFSNQDIRYIVAMPDSMNSKLFPLFQGNMEIIQCLNETDAVTIASGLNLSGSLSVVMMENSGMRSACDIISRFETLHHIHNIYILSCRGEVGEENWWGIRHKQVTGSMIRNLQMFSLDIHDTDEWEEGLAKAVRSFRTEQTSVVLNLTADFFNTVAK